MSIEEIINVIDRLADGAEACSIAHMEPEAEQKIHENSAKALREAIALLKTHPEAQSNEPLTQKQLQFMSSDPVWIVREDGADRWALIRYANSGGINTYGCGFLAWEDLGKTWRAYLRPLREEETP